MFRFRAIALVVAIAVMAVACGDSAPALELGEGVLPETVPSDFPIPTTAVVGATLVDNENGRTEVSLRIPASVPQVAQSFELNLVNRGFVVDNSSGDETSWKISFRRDDIDGEIAVDAIAEQGSQAVLDFNH